MVRAERLTKVALFASLTAVGAQVSLPIGEVPITLQVLFVLLTGFLLKPDLALLSQLLYLFLGALGFPVFAGFRGGIAHLYGPTAGYLWAFPLASFVVSYFCYNRSGYVIKALSALGGIALIYLLGWVRLGLFFNGNFIKAFQVGVLPFIGIDVLKAMIAVAIAEKVMVFVGAKQRT